MFEVTVADRSGASQRHHFDKPEVTVGRDPASDIPLPRGNISKRHARITQNPDGTFLLTDEGSTNGTFFNGARVRDPCRLAPGDQVFIGDFVLQVAPAAAMPAERRARTAPAALDKVRTRLDDSPGSEAVASGFGQLSSDDALAPTPVGAAPREAVAPVLGGAVDSLDEGWDELGPAVPAAAVAPERLAEPLAAPAPALDDDWGEDLGFDPGAAATPSESPAATPSEPAAPRSEPASRLPVGDAVEPAAAGASGGPDVVDAAPMPTPAAADADVVRALVDCLTTYVDIDVQYRTRAIGALCACGSCLLCRARAALARVSTT